MKSNLLNGTYNPSIDIFELYRVCLSPNYEALKLFMCIWSSNYVRVQDPRGQMRRRQILVGQRKASRGLFPLLLLLLGLGPFAAWKYWVAVSFLHLRLMLNANGKEAERRSRGIIHFGS